MRCWLCILLSQAHVGAGRGAQALIHYQVGECSIEQCTCSGSTPFHSLPTAEGILACSQHIACLPVTTVWRGVCKSGQAGSFTRCCSSAQHTRTPTSTRLSVSSIYRFQHSAMWHDAIVHDKQHLSDLSLHSII